MPAIAEPPTKTRPEFDKETKTKTRRQPPYAVVVLNDDEHTFDYVIATFMKVFGYDVEKCFQLAKTIHEEGRAIVWIGSLEVAELKRDQIKEAGPDYWSITKVTWPLSVELEPQ